MSEVFVLWHAHELDDGVTDEKLVGVYSSEAEARGAIARKLGFPGFKSHPGGFLIDRYALDQDAWSEGFEEDRA